MIPWFIPGYSGCFLSSIYGRSPYNRGTNVLTLEKNTGLKVYKFMGIQNQEERIGHVKQSKSHRFQVRFISVSQAKHGSTHIFPKSEILTLTVVFIYSYVIPPSCIFVFKYKPPKEKI